MLSLSITAPLARERKRGKIVSVTRRASVFARHAHLSVDIMAVMEMRNDCASRRCRRRLVRASFVAGVESCVFD